MTGMTTTRLAAGLSVILLCLAGSSLADVTPSRSDPGGRADRSRRLVFRRDTCPGDPGDDKQCNSTSLQRSLTRTDKDYDSGTYVGNNSMCLKLMKDEDRHGPALLTSKDQRIQTQSTVQRDSRRIDSRRERRSLSAETTRRTDEIREGRRRVTTRSVDSTLADRRMDGRRVVGHKERASVRVETRRVLRSERRERSPSEASSTRRSSRTADDSVRSPVESVRSRRTSLTERRDASAQQRSKQSSRLERRVSSAQTRVSSQGDSETTQRSSRIERRISSGERRTSSPDPRQSSRVERRISPSERRTQSPDSVRAQLLSRVERSVSFVERKTQSPVAAARIERRSVSADETTRSASTTERTRQSARAERRIASMRTRQASRLERRSMSAERRAQEYREQASRVERRGISAERRAQESREHTSKVERRGISAERRAQESREQTSRVERRGISAERRAQESREQTSRVERRMSSTAEKTARQTPRTQRRIASIERRTRTERRLSLSAERVRSTQTETSRATRRSVSADARIQASRIHDRRVDDERTAEPTDAARTRETSRALRRISAVERRTSPARAERNVHVSRSGRLSFSRDTRTSEVSSSRQTSTEPVRTERRVSSADVRIQSRLDRRTDRVVASLSRAQSSPMSDRRLKRSTSVRDERTVESLSRSSVSRRLTREDMRTTSQRRLTTETAAREVDVERRAARRTDSGTRRSSVDNSRRSSEESVARRRSESGERSVDSARRVTAASETRRLGERLTRQSAERSRHHRAEASLVRVAGKSDSTRQIRRIVSEDQVSLHRQSSAVSRDETPLRTALRVDGYDTLDRSAINTPKSVENDNHQDRRNHRAIERSQRSASRESLYRRMVNILPQDRRLERRQQETRNMRRVSEPTRRYQGERQKETMQRKSTNEARRLDIDRREISSRTPLVKLSFNDLQTDERRSQPANKPASMRKFETESAEGRSSRTRETVSAGERREIALKVSRETQTRRNVRTDVEERRRSLHVASVRQKERVDARTKTTSQTRGLSTDIAQNYQRRAHETNALSERNSRLDGSRRTTVSPEARHQRQGLQQRSSDVSSTETTRDRRATDMRSASETRELARSSRRVDAVEATRTVRSSNLDRQIKMDHSARKSRGAANGLRRLERGSPRSNRRTTSSERPQQTTTTRRTVEAREDADRRLVKLDRRESKHSHFIRQGVTRASREDRRLERSTSYRQGESIREDEARRRSVDSRRASRLSEEQTGTRKAFASENQRNFRAIISSLSTSHVRTVRDGDKEGPRFSRRTSASLKLVTTKVEDSRRSHASATANKDFKTEENQLSVPAFARPDLIDNNVPDNYVSYVLAAILIGATIFYDSLVHSSLEASLSDWCGSDRLREVRHSVEGKLSAGKEMELAGKSKGTPGSLGSILAGVASVRLF